MSANTPHTNPLPYATPDGKVYVGGAPFPGEETPPWAGRTRRSPPPLKPSTPPNGPGTWGLRVYPCDGGYHDYTVGPTAAVCNRCDRVVEL